MKKGGVAIFILIGALLTLFWIIGTRNKLVSLEEDVKQQESQIEINLQRRAELIPNLVATVKGYSTHEEEVFTQIADARAKLAGCLESNDLSGAMKADEALNSAIGRLLVISEDYPDLTASELYIGLTDELAGCENRIAVSRTYYTEAVTKYNKAIRQFPTSLVASFTGFEPMEYFEASESAKDAPVVDFSK